MTSETSQAEPRNPNSKPTNEEFLLVRDLLTDAADIDLLLEVQTGPDFDNLMHVLRDLPVLPFARETVSVFNNGDLIASSQLFPKSTFESFMSFLNASTLHIARGKAGRDLTTVDEFIEHSGKIVEGGRHNRATTLLRNVLTGGQAESRSDRKKDQAGLVTPLILLNMATLTALTVIEGGLKNREVRLSPPERRQLVIERADQILRDMCVSIIRGEQLPPKQKDAIAYNVLLDAVSALRACYNLCETDAEKLDMLMPLIAVKMGSNLGNTFMTSKKPRHEPSAVDAYPLGINWPVKKIDVSDAIAATFPRLVASLSANGIELSEELQAKVASEGIKFSEGLTDEELESEVQRVHVAIRMRQITRGLVQGIANGDISYPLLFMACNRMDAAMLSRREREISIIKEITAARQRAEKAAEQERLKAEQAERLEKQRAYLEALKREAEKELNSIGITWDLLSENEATGVPQPRASAENEKGEKISSAQVDIDPNRLIALKQIKDAFSGESYKNRFTKRRAKVDPAQNTTESRKKRSKKREVYHVLEFDIVDNDGNLRRIALADCVEVGNPTFLLVSLMPGVPDWRVAFSDDKDFAVESGAIPITHFRRGSDPAQTADDFMMHILELAYAPVEQLLELWAARQEARQNFRAKRRRRAIGRQATATDTAEDGARGTV